MYIHCDLPSIGKREENRSDKTIKRDTTGGSTLPILIYPGDRCSIKNNGTKGEWEGNNRHNEKAIIDIKPTRTCPEIHHLLFADESLFFLKGSLENTQALKSTLDEYCKALGQHVNFSKSSLFCREEVNNTFSRNFAALFGMNLVRDPGKYFGLSSLWGRSKCEFLSF